MNAVSYTHKENMLGGWEGEMGMGSGANPMHFFNTSFIVVRSKYIHQGIKFCLYVMQDRCKADVMTMAT